MSGNVHRRRPATLVLVALVVGALAMLGVAARAGSDPMVRGGDARADTVSLQPAVQHVAKRVIARLARFRSIAVSAAQRIDSSAAVTRGLSIALLSLFGLWSSAGRGRRRPAMRMHGVRAPPLAPAQPRHLCLSV
jgi:hypothetical protein